MLRTGMRQPSDNARNRQASSPPPHCSHDADGRFSKIQETTDYAWPLSASDDVLLDIATAVDQLRHMDRGTKLECRSPERRGWADGGFES
jgi:hypothetical protein